MKTTTCNEVYNENCVKICPIVYAVSLIGQKWKIPIIWNIAEAEMLHYNELKRVVSPITNTVLTRCLRELEESGLVNRHNHNTIPPSVEYSLTEQGKSLLPTLNELFHWGEKQLRNNANAD